MQPTYQAAGGTQKSENTADQEEGIKQNRLSRIQPAKPAAYTTERFIGILNQTIINQ